MLHCNSRIFLVAALEGPCGGNLDRLQIIKGWLDAAGKTHEKIFDVAWSDPQVRKRRKDGRVPAVGSTVDVARVIEIPTPRWTAYDAAYFKVKMSPEVPMTTQEKAWSSPIWYSPGK